MREEGPGAGKQILSVKGQGSLLTSFWHCAQAATGNTKGVDVTDCLQAGVGRLTSLLILGLMPGLFQSGNIHR